MMPSILAPETQSMVITNETRDVIGQVTYFIVENIRTARRFIASLKLDLDIDELHFKELSKNTNPDDLFPFLQPLFAGHDVVVLSEAGAPGIADPGSSLVSWCHQSGILVRPVSGPSSFMLALMASGFSGQSFCFNGYLPVKPEGLVKKIQELESKARKGTSQLFMEAPYRNNQLMERLMQVLHAETWLCVATNLTSSSEFVKTMQVRSWKSQKIDLHKQPTVFILGQPA